jgi:hypothetical protein
MSHGGKKLTLGNAPHSRLNQGFFGRMFRNLPPYNPPGESEDEKRRFLIDLGKSMAETPDNKPEGGWNNKKIPAGYTYFGQFVDHDITFDPTSSLDRQNDPQMLENFRTPRFDLDNLYGAGPANSPFMYNSDGTFIIGRGKNENEDDLPRIDRQENGKTIKRAIIGDMRNDENINISQLQLAFLKFHNKVMQDVGDFYEAQRLVRWHYQYIVIHDFLKRIIGEELLTSLLPKSDASCKKLNLCYYNYKYDPFMPVEFSVAAYRFGHSMVRPKYSLNDSVQDIRTFKERGHPTGGRKHLGGFRQLPKDFTIQWNLFFDFNDGTSSQHSRKIDPFLSDPLQTLPANIVGKQPPFSLAALNLLRGWRMGLPSGQSIARAMSICDCDDETLADGSTPLFQYILQEAASSGSCGGNSERLGAVGGRIVGEVFLGLLAGDPNSYFNIDPCWNPKDAGIITTTIREDMELADIMKCVG